MLKLLNNDYNLTPLVKIQLNANKLLQLVYIWVAINFKNLEKIF